MSVLGVGICIVPVYLAIFYWSLAIFFGYLVGPSEAWSLPKPNHGIPFPPKPQKETETETKFDSSNFLTAKDETVLFADEISGQAIFEEFFCLHSNVRSVGKQIYGNREIRKNDVIWDWNT